MCCLRAGSRRQEVVPQVVELVYKYGQFRQYATVFPLGAGTPAHPETRALDFWIHFADRGWQGPYPGTASVAVTSNGAQPGGYIVTFTITWRQLFERTHTWVCAVAPDGAVALRSETGDAVP